jgi:hypothetical protein
VSEKHYSICHVVRDETMRLFERVEVGGRELMLAFEQRVLWLRESETKIMLRHDGQDVDERSTLSDFYGYLVGLEAAVMDAAAIAARFRIGFGDRLSVDLDLTITDRPVMVDESQEAKDAAARWKGETYRKSYLRVPGYSSSKSWFLSDKKDESGYIPTLESVKFLEKKSIYSTRRDETGIVPFELAAWIATERRRAEIISTTNPEK